MPTKLGAGWKVNAPVVAMVSVPVPSDSAVAVSKGTTLPRLSRTSLTAKVSPSGSASAPVPVRAEFWVTLPETGTSSSVW